MTLLTPVNNNIHVARVEVTIAQMGNSSKRELTSSGEGRGSKKAERNIENEKTCYFNYAQDIRHHLFEHTSLILLPTLLLKRHKSAMRELCGVY